MKRAGENPALPAHGINLHVPSVVTVILHHDSSKTAPGIAPVSTGPLVCHDVATCVTS